MARKLKYIGRGEFFPGIPTADFTCDSDQEAERLVASGLYEYAGKGQEEKPSGERKEEG